MLLDILNDNDDDIFRNKQLLIRENKIKLFVYEWWDWYF